MSGIHKVCPKVLTSLETKREATEMLSLNIEKRPCKEAEARWLCVSQEGRASVYLIWDL